MKTLSPYAPHAKPIRGLMLDPARLTERHEFYLESILREVAELFPGPWMHAGLDEAVFENCDRCRERGGNQPDGYVFTQHVLAIYEIIHDCGKRMVMWADAIETHPELLDLIPRDIVLAHWHYRDVPPNCALSSASVGFTVLGAAAVSGDMLQPNPGNVSNVEEIAALVRALPEHVRGGMITCWWEPFRILRDTALPALAYAGAASDTASKPEWGNVVADFVQSRFGLSEDCGKALTQQYATIPTIEELRAMFPDTLIDLHDALNLAEAPDFEQRRVSAEAALKDLLSFQGKVEKHKAEFNSFILSARVVSCAFCNVIDLATACDAYRTAADQYDAKRPMKDVKHWETIAREGVRSAAERTRELADAVAAEWDRTRYADDPKKDNRSPRLRQRAAKAFLPLLIRSSRVLTHFSKETKIRFPVTPEL